MTKQRFLFIHALRGIACAMVVLHHLMLDLNRYGVVQQLGFIQSRVLQYGRVGVQIFFVISGFVIAHSLRNFDGTPKSALRFAIRRQLRLDPPYWAAIMIGVSILIFQKILSPETALALPGFRMILANLLYAHRVLQVREILGVSWTLCIEIQLYLVFILLMLAAFRAGNRPPASVMLPVLTVTALASMWLTSQAPEQAWVFPYWHYFVGGVVAYLVWQNKASASWLYILFAAAFARLCYLPDLFLAVGWTTVSLVYLVARMGLLTTLSLGRPIQLLGTLSYSLYLLHRPVMTVLFWIAKKHGMHNWLPVTAWGCMTLAVSVAAAYLLWVFVESPSMKWAARVKDGSRLTPAFSSQLGFSEVAHPILAASPAAEG